MNRARRDQKLHDLVAGVQLMAARQVRRVLLPEGDPERHPDASLPWKEASVSTRCSIALVTGTMATERVRPQAPTAQAINIVLLPPVIKDGAQWELAAQAPQRAAIEAVAVEKKEPVK